LLVKAKFHYATKVADLVADLVSDVASDKFARVCDQLATFLGSKSRSKTGSSYLDKLGSSWSETWSATGERNGIWPLPNHLSVKAPIPSKENCQLASSVGLLGEKALR